MALKPDRISSQDGQYIDFFMNEVAERGGIVCYSTVGSGTAMDQSAQLCTYVPDARMSGVTPLGVLMNDMVNLDLTRQHINWHKDEVQKGGKVTIWSKGTVVTDRIYAGQTPTVGQPAYVCHSGYIAASDLVNNTDNGPDGSGVIGAKSRRYVGRFMSTKDEDGYAKVTVNLP